MSKHALLSPSSSDRWMNCPGSVALSLTVPEPGSSPFAEEGTKFHEYCERLTRTLFFQPEYLTDVLQTAPNDEMYGHAETYLEYLCKIRDSEWTGAGSSVLIEEKLPIYGNVVYGTADFVMVGEERAILVDIKYGQGVPVAAAKSTQLHCYAVGVLRKHPCLKEVIVAVYQPRTSGNVEYNFNLLKQEKIVAFRERMIECAEEALAQKDGVKPVTLCAGDWCRWCPAAAVCPELVQIQKQHRDTAVSMLSSVPEIQNDRFENAPIEQLVQIYNQRGVIDKFYSALEKKLREMTASGLVTELKLVQGRPRRQWRRDLPDNVIIDMLGELGVEEPERRIPCTIGAAEKSLGKKRAKEVLSELCEFTVPTINLVSADDPREAVQLSGAAVAAMELLPDSQE